MVPALTPLALLGAAHHPCSRAGDPGLLLLALPLYYLATESFFLYEWRVAVPMHYALFACAAAPLVAAWSALRSALAPPWILPIRTRRDSRSSDTTPCRAGRTLQN